jgi:hypothetical protein
MGNTALAEARDRGELEVATTLMKAGALFDAQDKVRTSRRDEI